MVIKYARALSEKELGIAGEISARCGVSPDTARLLLYRGIDDANKAQRFLSPSAKYFYDPFLLGGVKEAVERITLARDKNEKALVFGDYDADGICAATVLSACLEEFGVETFAAVPERENGYGLNTEIIDGILKERRIDLIITVDCGVSDAAVIEEIKKRYADVIVTDHHEPPENLPDCITIDPKIKGEKYPFDGLCGAGVAYKLGRALIGDRADKYLDLVATATVADSMDLIDENRDIVKEGLKLFNGGKLRQAFKYLIGDGDKEITAQTLAYSVAPKINAGGRQGDAGCALRLFTTEDAGEIFDLAAKLNAYNIARQTDCENVYVAADEKIRAEKLYEDAVISVKGDDWNAGVIGIVSAKLSENYGKPVIVFAKFKDGYKGSARSVEGINIFDALTFAKDLLVEYGGHSQAAGMTVLPQNFEKLRRALNEFAANFKGLSGEKEIFVEVKADKPVDMRFIKEIELLAPFGTGNRRPLFATDVFSVEARPLKNGSAHYAFATDACEMLDFNGGIDVELLSYPVKKTLVYETNYSVFRGKESAKGFLREIVFDEKELYDDITDKINGGEISDISSSRAEFVNAYKVLKDNKDKPFINAVNFYFSVKPTIGLKQFTACFNVFSELGIVTVKQDKLAFREDCRFDLADSEIYRKIKGKGL